jgi:hypothetical protein
MNHDFRSHIFVFHIVRVPDLYNSPFNVVTFVTKRKETTTTTTTTKIHTLNRMLLAHFLDSNSVQGIVIYVNV